MAINSSGSASLVWRVRKSGNNLNGGGYDPSQANVLATTLNGAVSSGATSLTVVSATGWPSSGNYYARIGNNVYDVGASRGDGLLSPTASEVVLVTGGQGTTTWTVTRGQLGTSAAAWASGAVVDNELTRCNTAAASGSAGTSTASTTFVDATFNAFNLTHVGNAIYLSSGAGTTPGFYTVVSITNSSTVVLDRASGTYTVGVWKLGGGWADFRTNTTLAQATINPGNTCYIQGPGTDPVGPRTADYTPGATILLPAGSNSTGAIKFIGEYGRPALQASGTQFAASSNYNTFAKLYFMGKATSSVSVLSIGEYNLAEDCVFDENGFDQALISFSSVGIVLKNCEFFNSGSAPASANYAVVATGSGITYFVTGCNFHDLTSGAISSAANNGFSVTTGNIFANLGAAPISLSAATPIAQQNIIGNTFDSNSGDCISATSVYLPFLNVYNNLFTNNTGMGTAAISISGGSVAANNLLKLNINWNSFYNNTANVSGISLGKHDTLVGSNPYVGQSTENYTLA